MAYENEQYERALGRAWREVAAAQDVAANQGRRSAQRQLGYVARVLTELQADVVATAAAMGPRQAAVKRYTNGHGEHAFD